MGKMRRIPLSDEKIIELYWIRDESAILRTDEKYGDYCFSVAYHILCCREDSEECVNDTWLRTWSSIPPAWPSFLKQFLAKITRNLSLDYYRSGHAKKRGEGEVLLVLDELSECVSGTENVEMAVFEKQLEEAINDFVGGLPSQERNIFIRRYFFLDQTAEIAKRYALKEPNIRKILSRTRVKLKKYLLEEGYEI